MRKYALLSAFLSLFAILIISPKVYASGLSPEFWAYWWAENQCGVDFSKYTSTDEGSSLNDIIDRYGEKSLEESFEEIEERIGSAVGEGTRWTKEQVQQAAAQTGKVITDTTTTAVGVGAYVTEKVGRTVVDNGRTFLDISGSDWWNSLFNDFFNDGGYKQQYEENNSNDTYSGECCGHSITVSIKNAEYITVTGMPCPVIDHLWSELAYASGYINSILTWNIDGNIWYSLAEYGGYAIKSMTTSGNEITLTIIVNDIWNHREYEQTYTYYVNGGTAGENDGFSPDGGLTPKPPSCGVINMNGDWVDVPTNPDDRPEGWVINPDGTVTIDGQDYPIYVETDSGDSNEDDDTGSGQLTDDGLMDIIKYVNENPWGNNWNNPWNEYNQPNGNNSNNPFGLSIDGFFNNVGKAVGNAIDTLFKGIIDLLKKLLQAFIDLFEGGLIGKISSVHWDFHFDIVNDILDIFFGAMGVNS